MPDLLGYDARTKWSRVASAALAAGLSRGADFSWLKNYYPSKNPFMAPLRGYRKPSRFFRSRYGPRRRRRAVRVRRKGKVYQRRGSRYTGRRYGKYRTLKTSMACNDYRKFRCVTEFTTDLILKEGPSLQNNFAFDLIPDNFDQFLTNKSRWREFRLSNVQYVIEPRSLITGASTIRVNNFEIPYLAARSVIPTTDSTLLVPATDVRRTPGYTWIPITSKKRTVVNIRPSVRLLDSMSIEGSNITITQHKAMPWVETQASESAAPWGRLEVRVPHLDVQNGDELRWSVRCYADVRFRGSLEDLVPPLPDTD